MRAFLGLFFGIILFVPIAGGCGPALSDEDLGTVIYDVDDLPGADQEYEYPETHSEKPGSQPDEAGSQSDNAGSQPDKAGSQSESAPQEDAEPSAASEAPDA